jgi:hypothetical protein
MHLVFRLELCFRGHTTHPPVMGIAADDDGDRFGIIDSLDELAGAD